MKRAALRRALNRGGFTFIELLIVSAIILVLLSFSTPLFRRSFSDLELKDTASNITKFIIFAQEKAIIDRSIYKISFDFDKKTYQLFRATGEGQNITYTTSAKDRFGNVIRLPKDIDYEGRAKEIFFYPDGHSDMVELRLANTNKKVLIISTTGILGNVVIREEKE